MRTFHIISLFSLSTIVSSAQSFTFNLNENKTEERHSVTVKLNDRRVEGSKQDSNVILFEKEFTDIAVNQQGIVSISFMHNEEPVFSPPNDGKTYVCLITPSRMMVSKDVVTNSTYQYLPVSEYEYKQTYDQLVESVRKMNVSQPVKITTSLIKATKKYDMLGDFHEGRAMVEKNGKCGFINTNGEEVINCQYDCVEPFKDGLAKVKKSGKWGYINVSGNQIVKCEYDDISPFDASHLLLMKNGKYGLMNKSGDVLTACIYTSIGKFEEGLSLVANDRLLGYINLMGEEIIPCRYNAIDDEEDGMRLVTRNGLFGYVSSSGKEIVECRYRYLGKLSDECFVAKNQDGKTGFIDARGNVIVPFQYDEAKDMSEGLAPVKVEGLYGFINKKNEIVIKCKYENVGSFGSGMAPVKIKKGWNYINKEGKTVLKLQLQSCYPFHDGLARVEKNNYWGYINTMGELVIPNAFTLAEDFNKGLAKVKRGAKWGLFNSEGEKILDYIYDEIGTYKKNGLCKVVLDKNIGFVDRTGKEVVKCEYESVEDYDDKYILVVKKGKKGLLNRAGKEIFPCLYDQIVSVNDEIAVVKCVSNLRNSEERDEYYLIQMNSGNTTMVGYKTTPIFSEGIACVSKTKVDGGFLYGFIDKKSNEAVPFIYQMAYPFSEGVAAVKQFDKCGFITKDNKKTIDFIYDETQPFSDGLARVKYNGQWGYVNKRGYDTFKSEFNMKAPQILPKENGTIELDDCPKTYPDISIKVSDEGDEAWIYYDGELLTHVKGGDSEPLVSGSQISWSSVLEYSGDDQSDLDYIHFLDANFDGYVDVFLGFGAPRSNNTLLVWSPTNKQFEIVEDCYFQNITLFPVEKKVASFDSCGMAGACVGGSLFRINGNRIVDEQAFATNVDIDDPNLTFTYTIYKGNDDSDVLIECHKKSQLPKEWKDKLSILLDYMWDDLP